jgi:hypothetical protein
MNGFKAVRKLTGDQYIQKFKIDLQGQTVMARRDHSGFSSDDKRGYDI